jgi:hypothetical protein
MLGLRVRARRDGALSLDGASIGDLGCRDGVPVRLSFAQAREIETEDTAAASAGLAETRSGGNIRRVPPLLGVDGVSTRRFVIQSIVVRRAATHNVSRG